MSKQLRSGDTLRLRVGHTHRFSCCDCGLAHDFTIDRLELSNGEIKTIGAAIEVTIKGNARATAANRRKRNGDDR